MDAKQMYLIDTNIICEHRKKQQSHPGVIIFFKNLHTSKTPCYLSSITLGELERGIAMCRYRNDMTQANALQNWLNALMTDFVGSILPFNTDCARVWGHICTPDNTNIIDKQIAATALLYDLTLVTRNVRHVEGTGVRVLNPFE